MGFQILMILYSDESRNTQAQISDNQTTCEICQITIMNQNQSEEVISCNQCEHVMHKRCLCISDDHFTFISNLGNLDQWSCQKCQDIQHVKPNIPCPDIMPNKPRDDKLWASGEDTIAQVCSSVNSVYEKVVRFKKNIFNVPSGAAGKLFIEELSFWLKQFNNQGSQLNSIALKAFMVLPPLLLQKPSSKSKAKEHTQCLTRRLQQWKEGNINTLLREATCIQQKMLKRKPTSSKTPEELSKIFARLIMQGKITAALKVLDKESQNGVHALSDDIIRELSKKHPTPAPFQSRTLLLGPVEKIPDSYFNNICEQKILTAALKTQGSAGPSGMDADVFRRILSSKNFTTAGKNLREEIALMTRNLCTMNYHPSLLEPLTACRLIPLNKNPGVRPIGVGEVLRRISVSRHSAFSLLFLMICHLSMVDCFSSSLLFGEGQSLFQIS